MKLKSPLEVLFGLVQNEYRLINNKKKEANRESFKDDGVTGVD